MLKSEKLLLPVKPPCLLPCLFILILWNTSIKAIPVKGDDQEAGLQNSVYQKGSTPFSDHESYQRFKGYYIPTIDQIQNGNQLGKRFLGYSVKSNPGRRSIADGSSSYFRDTRFLGYPGQRSAIGKRFLGAGNIKRFRLVPHIWGEDAKRVPMTNDFLGKRRYVEEDNTNDIDQDEALLADVATYMRHWYPQYLTGGSFYFKRDGFGRSNRLQTNDFLG